MKTAVVFTCLVAVAACFVPPEFDEYVCPNNTAMTHVSYCFMDPCYLFEDNPHPCKNHPEAYCKYNACPNADCDWQFFVGNVFVECELDESLLK